MNCNERQISADELELDMAALVRALGYQPPPRSSDTIERAASTGSRKPMPPHMTELLQAALVEARPMLSPRWMWRSVEAVFDGDALVCRDERSTRLDVGALVRSQLKGIEAIAVFVVTIGSELERRARELMADPGYSLEGYVLDTIGSVAVESAADALEKEVAGAAADHGWRITNRFSPGYCTWKTAGQQALFSLLPAGPAGITLSESSLMAPIKSISGVIGLGPSVAHRPYMCDICSMTTCHQRLTEARSDAARLD